MCVYLPLQWAMYIGISHCISIQSFLSMKKYLSQLIKFIWPWPTVWKAIYTSCFLGSHSSSVFLYRTGTFISFCGSLLGSVGYVLTAFSKSALITRLLLTILGSIDSLSMPTASCGPVRPSCWIGVMHWWRLQKCSECSVIRNLLCIRGFGWCHSQVWWGL